MCVSSLRQVGSGEWQHGIMATTEVHYAADALATIHMLKACWYMDKTV